MTRNPNPNTGPVNLSGAYALDAVDGDEAVGFEEFMAESDETRYEVTELRDTAVLLGLAAAPVQPPASLKASLMSAIATTPQLPAEAPIAAPAPIDTVAADFAQAPSATTLKTQARWFTRPAAVLASMAAAIALIAGGVAVNNGITQDRFAQAQSEQFDAIAAAPDVKTLAADVAGGGQAKVTWSNSLLTSAVTVVGMGTLPSSKTYELWYINGDGARPAGTFTVGSSDSKTMRVLEGTMKAGDTIGVTVEPAGGSRTPTTDPIVAVTTA